MSTCSSLTPMKEAKRLFRGLSVSGRDDPVGRGPPPRSINGSTKLVDVQRSNFSDAGSIPAISTRALHQGVLFCLPENVANLTAILWPNYL